MYAPEPQAQGGVLAEVLRSFVSSGLGNRGNHRNLGGEMEKLPDGLLKARLQDASNLQSSYVFSGRDLVPAFEELLAYRQSGALEALKAAEPALWILAASGNKDAAEKHRAILATIAKLEAM
jgi:hypothetical protein